MIFLFTDYGLEGPYIGQVETVIHQLAPNEKVINLIADAPRNKPKESAYLLASLISGIPEGCIIFSVVDPGVGSDEDKPVILKIDGRWFVGADNGLFDIVARPTKAISKGSPMARRSGADQTQFIRVAHSWPRSGRPSR